MKQWLCVIVTLASDFPGKQSSCLYLQAESVHDHYIEHENKSGNSLKPQKILSVIYSAILYSSFQYF